MRITLTITSLLTLTLLTGCISMEQLEAYNAKHTQEKEEQERLAAKADTVRAISPEQTKKCKYINQVSAMAELSFFGGMEATEKTAMRNLKIEALKQNANGFRIADRLLDKGRGGYDQTRLTLYGDIYKCSGW
ncbi:MAG: hypothetical protein R3E73_15660 [Porticoccaceae bacterium]|nr:hypothetical protein [Pseudomonadales bacterium]MCP5171212.1 hypothetical protein [Pseudomonadales bacterium]MCP5301549.1 hypothetical protein [Pseudomonadales bacterium]